MIRHVTEVEWLAKDAAAGPASTHPCDDYRADGCFCKGACGCHFVVSHTCLVTDSAPGVCGKAMEQQWYFFSWQWRCPDGHYNSPETLRIAHIESTLKWYADGCPMPDRHPGEPDPTGYKYDGGVLASVALNIPGRVRVS